MSAHQHPPATTPASPARVGRRRWPTAALAAVAAVATALVLVIVGLAGYQLGAEAPRAPANDSADAGFARQMQAHHGQAVHLALIVRDRTTDAEVRTLAYDIATTQQQQAGQMYAWLRLWDLPQSSPAGAGAWMGGQGAASGGAMGMATPDQVRALEAASGVVAERMFLTLMIDHHRAGVAMATAALEAAESEEVLDLAEAIKASQQVEITQLEQMLAARR